MIAEALGTRGARSLAVDWLLDSATVVTMNPSRDVIADGAVLIRDGKIAYVGPSKKVPRRGVARIVDCKGAVVTPGLIHGHLHACQTLCRNRADGLELLDWLKERIWPFEAAHDAASMRASANLTFLELISSGATAALDMGSVRHYDEVFLAARECGFRLTGGKTMMDAGQGVPSGLLEDTRESLAQTEALIARWHGQAGGRLRYAVAPRFVLSCSEALLKGVVSLAQNHGVRIHTHASENTSECDAVTALTGLTNVAYFEKLGLLGRRTTLAHGVWLNDAERSLLRQTQTSLCHCPSANLKLASGYAKIPELLEAGIFVALGADGAPCNNNLDIFHEMRLAALMHLPRTGPRSVSADDVFTMATLGGARALGLEDDIGSLEVGKKADVTVVHLGASPHAQPSGDDVVAQLVYSARGSDVRDVFIDGVPVMRSRRVLTLDAASVVAEGARQANRVEARMKLAS